MTDTPLSNGTHTFTVAAIDIDGNVDPTPATHTWTMTADTTPPGTGILTGPAATVGLGAEILVEFFGTDNATPVLGLAFECAMDFGPFEPCTSPESLQNLTAGEHTFRVRAVDLAGNADAAIGRGVEERDRRVGIRFP